jgi:hypothetical protein
MVFDGTQRADMLTFTVTEGIVKTREYHFKVTALNYVGVSAYSEVLTCLAAVVPAITASFEVVGSELGQVTLSWQAPEDDGGSPITGYFIHYHRTRTSDTWIESTKIEKEYN